MCLLRAETVSVREDFSSSSICVKTHLLLSWLISWKWQIFVASLRHEKYRTQYRAMFVMNCTVQRDEVLRYKQERKQRNRKRRKGQKTEAAPDEAAGPTPAGMDADEVYHPVQCSECSTEVAVFDKDEVYHFFNILASHCWDTQTVFFFIISRVCLILQLTSWLTGRNPAAVAVSAWISTWSRSRGRSRWGERAGLSAAPRLSISLKSWNATWNLLVEALMVIGAGPNTPERGRLLFPNTSHSETFLMRLPVVTLP